jgi:spermidine synthase
MTPAPAAPLRERPLLLGLGTVTAATLALEVLLTRLLSVITWYSLAFLVVGMGLFGLTVGAVEVYLRPERYDPERLAASLADRAVEAAIAMPIAYALLLVVPLRVEAVATTVVLFLVFSAVLALPFVFAGAVVSAALTRSGLAVGRLYAVDLVGAAIGAPLVPVILDRFDAGSGMVLAGAACALGSAAFANSGGDRSRTRRGLIVAGALAVLAVVNGASPYGLVPLWVKGHAEERAIVDYETWNSHSRIQVMKEGFVPAQLWGAGAKCPPPWVRQRWLTIDGDAGTALYAVDDPTAVGFLACDVTSLVHLVRPSGPVAVIGVGGSRDIQAALSSTPRRPVVGVELNDKILDVLRGPLGAPTKVATYPTVELVHDDGRSWMARTDREFSVVQMSLIDTWAATGAGAHALGENGLYTVEAWTTFMARLAPGGIFTVSRWFGGGVRDETTRLLSLAVATLHRRGVSHARPHIILAASGAVATLLVGRDPFTPDDIARAEVAATSRGFNLLVLPGAPDANPSNGRILDAEDAAALERVTLGPSLDLRPPVDDRPFFFNMLRVRAWLARLPADVEYQEGNRRATLTLVLSFFSSLVLAGVAIVFPLVRRARPSGKAGLRLASALAYFAIIGVAFMLVEIALLQRLSLVLGHPSFSLIVVLASLVASAGLGSLASDRLPLDRPLGRIGLSFVLAAMLVGASFALPAWAPRIAPAALGTRIAFAAALTAALGFPMGMAFPAGMRTYAKDLGDETPWLWGINGVAGVIASSAAVMLALEHGIAALLIMAAFGYAMLAPIAALGAKGPRP